MMPRAALLIALLPLVWGWPMEAEKEMMMKFMMKGGEDGDMMEMLKNEGEDEDKDKMMKYMMMWKKEKMGHYPGDDDGCKKEDDSWKDWEEKKEKKEKAMKMMEEYKKFKEFLAKKKKMEEKMAKEEKEKMYEMWQKHNEMKMRKEKEKEFKDMIESFTEQKHKFAFKLAHEFLQLCQCAEVSEEIEKLSMFEIPEDSDLMANMTNEGTTAAMDSGDMEMLAKKMLKMSVEEKKKVFMKGLIKSMCSGAKDFIEHAKKFEEVFLVKYMEQNNSTTTD